MANPTLNINTQKSQEAINAIIDRYIELNKYMKEAGATGKSSYAKLTKAQREYLSVEIAMADAVNKHDKALKNMTKSQRSYRTQLTNQKRKTDELKKSNDKLTASLKKQENQTKKTGTGFNALLGSAKKLLGAFGLIGGVVLFRDIAKDVYETAKTFDGFGFAMEKVINDTLDLKRTTEFLDEITIAYGADIVTTTERYIKFDAAARQSNLGLLETQQIFGSVTKAAGVLGLKTDELQGIYLALEQMLSKGKVTTEELRRQLGERLPGAFGIMGKALGVSTSQLDKMLKKGEVLSSEALPKFAIALEEAYGIEAVEKVDTLQAAQIRLSNTWTSFVVSLTKDGSVLKSAFKSVLNFMTDTLNAMKTVSKEIKDAFKSSQDLVDEKNLSAVEQIQKDQEDSLNRIADATARGAEAVRQRFNLEDVLSKRILKNQKEILGVENARKENADAQAKKIVEQVKEYKTYDEFLEGLMLREDIYEKGVLARVFARIKGIDKVIKKTKTLNELTTEDDTTGKTAKYAKDLTEETNIVRNKRAIYANNELIKSDETTYARKIELLKENNQLEDDIAESAAKIKIAKAKETTKDLIGGEKELAERIININEEKETQIEQNSRKSNSKIKEWKEKASNNVILQLERERDIAIKTEKLIYENSAKTAKDKEELAKNLANVEIEYAKKILLAKIAILKAELATGNVSSDRALEILAQISALEAEIQGLPNTFQAVGDKQKEFWANMEKYAAEYADAIGDIFDNISEAKIETINAEIEAVKDKYDQEFEAAAGNEQQQANLEKVKEARVKALEQRRLKEEQKQAKIRKAFAIADIGIQTALAIQRATAASYLLGPAGPAWLATQIPLIAGLSALQLAAVLAAPIPQYKEGSPGIKEAHVGMINDGGKQEYIERNGELFTASSKNALVSLQPKDIIHKDFNALKNNSNFIKGYDDVSENQLMMFTAYNKTKAIQNNQLNKMMNGITKSIDKGFKKVKINNTIQNQMINDYGESLSRWN